MPAKKFKTMGTSGTSRWATKISRYPGYVQDYFLEIRRGEDTFGVMPMPHGPAQFSITENFATSVDFTLGPIPKREHSEPRSWHITIAGRSGTVPRWWFNTLADDDKSAAWPPFVIMQEFNDFLDTYQELAQQGGSRELSDEHYAFEPKYRWWLIFHALRENKHYAVELSKFVFDRHEATTRNSCTWTLVLEAWDDYVGQDTKQQQSILSYHLANTFSSIMAQVDVLANASDELKATIARAQQVEDANFNAQQRALWYLEWQRKGFLRLEQQMQELLARMTTYTPGEGVASYSMYQLLKGTPLELLGPVGAQLVGLRNYLLVYRQAGAQLFDKARDAAAAPSELIRFIAEATSSSILLLQAIKNLKDTNPATVLWDELVAAFEAVQTDLLTLLGRSGGGPNDLAAATKYAAYVPGSSGPPPSFGAYQAPQEAPEASAGYVVPPGVFDYKAISTLLFDTPDYWLSLAALNGAKDAQSDGSGAPLQPGTKILVPSGVSSNNSKNQNLDAMFGTDFLEGADGDWVCEQPGYQDLFAEGGSDVKLVSGVANLLQSLYNRMTTKKGDVKTFPQYGMLQAGPGDPVTAASAGWAAVDIKRQLLQDPRLADVKDIQVTFADTAWYIKFTAVPIGPQPDKVQMLVPMQAFSSPTT